MTDESNIKSSLETSRILWPVLIGVGVVGFLFWKNFDPSSLGDLHWNRFTIFFFCLALICLAARVFCYTRRLMLLSDGAFSFRKAMQLIFIWEFSSAVSPTNVGGSAVALFVLSREKIGAAKTSTIVIYTIILDTIFVMISIPFWYFFFGSDILGPGNFDGIGLGRWEITLLVAYLVMSSYGMFLFYALVKKPEVFRWLAGGLAKVPFLRRYRDQLLSLGENIKLASQELFRKSASYHLKAFVYTVLAWSSRFILIICLLAAFVQKVEITQSVELFARIQTMFVLIAFSPTPGGSGLAEALFGNLLSDIVPIGIGVVVAMVWRALSYYFFILMGIIVLPGWLKQHVRKPGQSNE